MMRIAPARNDKNSTTAYVSSTAYNDVSTTSNVQNTVYKGKSTAYNAKTTKKKHFNTKDSYGFPYTFMYVLFMPGIDYAQLAL